MQPDPPPIINPGLPHPIILAARLPPPHPQLLNPAYHLFSGHAIYHVHGKLLPVPTETIQPVRTVLQGLGWTVDDVCYGELFEGGGGHCDELF